MSCTVGYAACTEAAVCSEKSPENAKIWGRLRYIEDDPWVEVERPLLPSGNSDSIISSLIRLILDLRQADEPGHEAQKPNIKEVVADGQ